MMCKVILVIAFLAVLSGNLVAAQQKSCQDAQGITFNDTNLNGFWNEVVRNPAPNATCIQANVQLFNNVSNTYFYIDLVQSDSNASLYQNVEQVANFTLDDKFASGYTINFTVNGQAPTSPGPVVKILQLLENNNYVVGCSYNTSASAGFILSKSSNFINQTILAEINNNASALFSNFQNGIYNNVTQTGCFRSSASQSLPVISGLLALIMVLINRQ